MSDYSLVSNKIVARISPFLLASSLFAGTVLPAQATDLLDGQLRSQILQQSWNQLQADVANTGDNTTVQQNSTDSQTASVASQNTAVVNQEVNATANTGYNEASRNISIGGNAGIITTGDARVQTTLVAGANSTQVGITGAPQTAQGLSGGQNTTNTGDNASVSSAFDSTKTAMITGVNNAVIYQTTNASANTGGNVADRNISIGGAAGVITTGQASVGVSYLVSANNSVAVIGGTSDNGSPGTGASIVRANTGQHSTFGFSEQFNTSLSANTNSVASLNQSCGTANNPCSAITGGNTSDRGIARGGDVGVITTAPAAVVLQFLANVNPTNVLLSAASHTGGPASSEIANTGDESSFHTNSATTTSAAAAVANTAAVSQSAYAAADTGRNTSNRNISIGGDAGVITTGDALVDVMMFMFANPTAANATLP